MQMNTEKDGSVLIITPVDPRLDAAVATEFRDQLFSHIDSGESQITIDLGHVEFVDSSGLGALVSGLKRLGGQGELNVTNPNSTVMKLFKMTRLDKVLKVIESTDAG